MKKTTKNAIIAAALTAAAAGGVAGWLYHIYNMPLLYGPPQYFEEARSPEEQSASADKDVLQPETGESQ